MKRHLTLFAGFIALSLSNLQGSGSDLVDPELPVYKAVSGVSGNLDSVGSDTLNNLMTLWAESFQAIYPNVNVQIEGKGSSTAPPALIEGTAQLGPMSRSMKSTEIDKFEDRFGYKPTPIGVGLDALAVYLHKDNPVDEMSLKEIDSIFSNTFKRGGEPIETWGDLNLGGEWAPRGISVYGRNSASGTYGFFKKVALVKGDFKPTVKEQPGSSAVVQGVASDLYGIGYSGIGYKTSGVKTVAISSDSDVAYGPDFENCINGDYPLARMLLIYINRSPVEPLDTLTKEYLKFILSKQGQEIVVKDGYYPIPNEIAQEYLDILR